MTEEQGNGGAEEQGHRGALPPPEGKAAYVRQMFGRIARRYDLINHLMTLGRDRAWRRYAVNQLDGRWPMADGQPEQEGSGPRKSKSLNHKSKIVLDLATGTGDLALQVLRQYPGARVIALDFSSEMLALARPKTAALPATSPPSLSLVAGDALRLPFPDNTFDAVVTGFALRNVTDIPTTFGEMARVTRPGGQIACLEITRPLRPWFRPLFHLYFYHLVPLIGGLISGQRAAYTYLPHSLTSFLTPDEIVAVMQQAGWQQVRYRRLGLGTVAIHRGVKGQRLSGTDLAASASRNR